MKKRVHDPRPTSGRRREGAPRRILGDPSRTRARGCGGGETPGWGWGRVDGVVQAPPYGIGESAAKNRTRGLKAPPTDYGDDDWDHEPADASVIEWMRANSRYQIIFGGNYFTLPPASCWLVWDKE